MVKIKALTLASKNLWGTCPRAYTPSVHGWGHWKAPSLEVLLMLLQLILIPLIERIRQLQQKYLEK